jgi:iron complex outermembrane receptor protein
MNRCLRILHRLTGRFIFWTVGCLLAGSAGAAVIEEVVVTATKREESAQDVPISVTAFTSESIQELGFDLSFDVGSHVPNLQFLPQGSRSIPFIFLRGVGNTSFFANSINPVAIYVDQAYVGQSSAQALQLFDLERVEVLRGPQGTLFGRNATGGLINFITRKPQVEDGRNARIELTGGNFGRFDVEAAGGIPLGENAAARVAVFQQLGSGMYDNVTPGSESKFGDVDSLGVRGQLRWQPVSQLDLLFNVHYGDDDSHNPAAKPGYIVSPFGVPNCPPGAASGELFNGCSDPFGFGQTVDPDFYDVQYTYSPEQELESYGFMLEANWDVGRFSLTSLTAWDTVDRATNGDDDANALLFLKDTFLADADWLSQELRVTTHLEGPFNWILGFNYYTDDLESQIHFAAPDWPPPPVFGFPFGVGQDLQQETESWAVFGEMTWNFSPDWTLRLGLRLTDDDREVALESFAFLATAVPMDELITVADARAAFLFPFILPTEFQDSWFEWSGRAALDWKFAEDQLLYVSASRGFKGGQFNGGALFDLAEATIADPEFTNNYEVGYKGLLFDRRIQFNVTGFYMEYEDQQTLVVTPTPAGFLPSLQNAGRSEIYGAEFELTWQPTDNWFVLFAGGYLDAAFDEFIDPVLGIDRSGNKLPHSPEWNLNGIARYEHPVANGMLGLQVDWWWLDDQRFDAENTPTIREDAHGQVNARASYSFWREKVELALFVRNLTEEEFVTTVFDTSRSGFGAHIHVLNQPRTFGGQIILRFE